MMIANEYVDSNDDCKQAIQLHKSMQMSKPINRNAMCMSA
jgi:hypothetical protein